MLLLGCEIADIYVLLADSDVEIRSLADTFLQALHTKDPRHVILRFNTAFSRLSAHFAAIGRDHFRQVAKVLMRNFETLHT